MPDVWQGQLPMFVNAGSLSADIGFAPALVGIAARCAVLSAFGSTCAGARCAIGRAHAAANVCACHNNAQSVASQYLLSNNQLQGHHRDLLPAASAYLVSIVARSSLALTAKRIKLHSFHYC